MTSGTSFDKIVKLFNTKYANYPNLIINKILDTAADIYDVGTKKFSETLFKIVNNII